MRTRAITLIVLAALVGAFAAAPASAEAATKRTGKYVKVAPSRFGTILTDGRGFTLYLFTADKSRKSRCYGECAVAWPPLLTKGAPRAGKRVKQRLLGTTRRRGGARQVTYNGHPLYYYVGETRPRTVLCQAVFEYGGWWYVVNRAGKAITRG